MTGMAGMVAVAKRGVVAALACACLAGAVQAEGKVPLTENAHIRDSLVAGRVADVLRTECSSLHARMLLVLQKLDDLKEYAIAEGYTEEEVKAFLKNKEQKNAMKALAAEYLAKAGAVTGDEDSYCRVGEDEIAKNTLAGSLLWSW
jgi:Family of unknown function (DUF5333)